LLGTADPARHGQDPLPVPRTVIGCDLSRAFLDVHVLPDARSARIENSAEAISAWLKTLAPDALVVLEATSGRDGALMAALAARGIAFARVNPRQAREFARAIGVLAKTDRVDARVLAEMGTRLDLPVTVPSGPARLRLAHFLGRRRQLVEIRKAEKARRHSAGQDEIAEEIETMIDLLSARIDALDRKIAALIAEDRQLRRQAELLAPKNPVVGPDQPDHRRRGPFAVPAPPGRGRAGEPADPASHARRLLAVPPDRAGLPA